MMSEAAAHVPVASSQTPLGHSASTVHARHEREVMSQTGASAVHCELSVHATHAPSDAQYGRPETPVQSMFVMHFATQSWSMQTGVSGDVQSADVVHWDIWQVPVESQTWPLAQPVICLRPKLSHCSCVLQHEA